jgi:hypothetical protein
LCQYAGYHADTDAHKRDRFRRGLNTKLKERLNLVRADNFNELVNMAITQEDCISAHRAKKKRKVTHWTLNCGTAEVLVGPKHRYPSTATKQYTRQMGIPTTRASSIQSATDTTTPAATAARPAAELSPVQLGKQQLSLFQLRQPVPFH